ncbi:substrate-binding domain-containing protein [Agrobacterium vitis]|uniref:substrate-binding domain-containing protein n=1 Tax=Agrobacterium vitis TaxID=373 RepID=UPI0015DA6DD5|nr:substrate-binding domain-containing protein [Agrobacterium vitis]MCF1452206.1 autoinducer 2 ABC transporter substrate-binding protein [Agrobacterium vitis]BCH55917.1 sugar ABC transporter substrate-binding protein [Agrobacterium vitis]
MRKTLMTSLLACALSTGTSHAAPAWTGADDMPTNPLACDAQQVPAAPVAYNGGTPTKAPDRKGKAIKIVDVPKLVGIGYFNSTSQGVMEAAKDLGNVNAKTDGSTKANIDDQVTLIDNYITSGVDGILFSANDPVAIAPVLKKALAAGINVVGYDADAEPDARQWFVNPATPNGVAKSLIDTLAKEIGPESSFAIVTSTFTTPNQARWIAEMSAYQAKCYPKMQWLETVEAQEDNILSFNQANTLINKYGADLKGIIGMTSVATPAAADAVTQAGQCGQISVVGLATPNAMKPYIKAGCVKSAVLWSTVDLGYAATQALRAAADGTLKPGDTVLKAGRLGDLQIINGSQILLGSPAVFTKDNIDKYNF